MYLIIFKSASVSCSVMSDSLQPTGGSPPGSSVHGILQAKILEWVAMPFSKVSSQPRDQTCISVSPELAVGFFNTNATWEACYVNNRA